jgi:hypothetical protein
MSGELGRRAKMMPQAIPLATSAEFSDEDVVKALGMALIEKEEERRIWEYHHLPMSHLIQPPISSKPMN